MHITWHKPETNGLTTYQKTYVDYVPDGDLVKIMEDQLLVILNLARGIDEAKLNYRYAAGKWSIPELFVHIADAERIFTYRILRIMRGDKTPLAGFEEDDYVKECGAQERNFAAIAEEFVQVRKSSICLLSSATNEQLERTGIANNMEVSALQLAYILVGHAMHHLRVIRERYLS